MKINWICKTYCRRKKKIIYSRFSEHVEVLYYLYQIIVKTHIVTLCSHKHTRASYTRIILYSRYAKYIIIDMCSYNIILTRIVRRCIPLRRGNAERVGEKSIYIQLFSYILLYLYSPVSNNGIAVNYTINM